MKRLRDHEDLLRQNNIAFQDAAENETPNAESADDSNDEHPEIDRPNLSLLSPNAEPGRDYEARYALLK